SGVPGQFSRDLRRACRRDGRPRECCTARRSGVVLQPPLGTAAFGGDDGGDLCPRVGERVVENPGGRCAVLLTRRPAVSPLSNRVLASAAPRQGRGPAAARKATALNP